MRERKEVQELLSQKRDPHANIPDFSGHSICADRDRRLDRFVYGFSISGFIVDRRPGLVGRASALALTAGSLADTKTAEDFSEQVITGKFARYFRQRILCL
jgi:hypothetical protein